MLTRPTQNENLPISPLVDTTADKEAACVCVSAQSAVLAKDKPHGATGRFIFHLSLPPLLYLHLSFLPLLLLLLDLSLLFASYLFIFFLLRLILIRCFFIFIYFLFFLFHPPSSTFCQPLHHLHTRLFGVKMAVKSDWTAPLTNAWINWTNWLRPVNGRAICISRWPLRITLLRSVLSYSDLSGEFNHPNTQKELNLLLPWDLSAMKRY